MTARCRFAHCDALAVDDGCGGIEWATNMGTPVDHDHQLPDGLDRWSGLELGAYRTITADPPWRLNAPGAGWGSDATRKYSTMSLDALAAIPVADLAHPDGAHLWLWCINSMIEEAHQLTRAWGFRPTTLLTWCKPGRPGVGHYLRNNTEHAIFATRGAPMTPAEKPKSTWYVWERGGHSVKPLPFYDLVERVSPGPYVELFQRAGRFGWDGWGHGFEAAASGPPSRSVAR